jgi:1-phosphatidylinositol-4-phosphate 5-kinase
MFYCGSGEFFVKTVTPSESSMLLHILSDYCKHLESNPTSFLVRFFGLHSLTLYSKQFLFVVMRNIFPPQAIINERYDIKGSWINRNANVIPPGKKTFCRHCGELFVSGSQIRCPEVVGVHEANIILKDNDLITKIRMHPESAFETIDILNKDSDALCKMGITDYSMLVGVRNLQYEVNPEKIIRR